MTFEPKKLSLIHLERGIQLLDHITEEGVSTQMVAIYTATPGILVKAKKDPSSFESMLDQAAEMDAEEAAQVIADFFQKCVTYLSSILGSLPQISEDMKSKIVSAQGPANRRSSHTSSPPSVEAGSPPV